MPLSVGSRLGHYEVSALIGEGGMGQVYQATDTKLNRQVALKILPEAFATDPDRLARFQREAQVLASLNHPGIAAIYGIEEQDDTRALVLELVEGPTLADLIAKGPIPVDEALPIAKQIAEALEAAHEQGVIHRDLKPANIKVRDDGTVKVLDFGLAKALEGDGSNPSESPTVTAAATAAGVILGTAAYMSPEQARGKPVDKRADIWAFGAVLYEMLTGRRPFQGRDVSEVLAAVIQSAPDWDALPGDTPSYLTAYLERCLEKEPKQRVHDIADVRLAMEGAFETTVGVPAEPVAAPPLQVWQRPLPLVAGIVALLFVTGFTVWSVTRPDPPRLTRVALATPPNAPLDVSAGGSDIAVSPDGTRIVYVGLSEAGTRQLYLRSLDGFELTPLEGTEGNPRGPFFSPDGDWVGYEHRDQDASSSAGLKRVSVFGGPPETISSVGDLHGASWGVGGTVVFSQGGARGRLWQVPATGGEPVPLTDPFASEARVSHEWPMVLPGGEAVLYAIRTLSDDAFDWQIAVLSVETGEEDVLIRRGTSPRFVSSGHIVYAVDGTLMAVPFDLDQMDVTGIPTPVLEEVLTKTDGSANFSVADDGTLVFVPGEAQVRTGAVAPRTLVWVDREGREEPLNVEPRPYYVLDVSPDGTQAAISIAGLGTSDVWIVDIGREEVRRLTFDPGGDSYPVWTSDSQRVIYRAERGGQANLFWRAADGTGTVDRLTESDNYQGPRSVTPDGTQLLLGDRDPAGSQGVGILSFEDARTFERLPLRGSNVGGAKVSPDGHWLAYVSDESGRAEIYMTPFPDVEGSKAQITFDGGQQARWAPDGTELFYVADERLMAVPIRTDPPGAGRAQVLFEWAHFGPFCCTWDIHPDGRRFLMVKRLEPADETTGPAAASGSPQIHVFLNWLEELTRLVPID